MKLVDLALKGVIPFKGLKLQFKKGLNAIIGKNSSGKTTIFHSILSGLFTEGWKEFKDSIRFSGTEPPRVLITFRSNGDIYRVIRELSTGAFVLYKYDHERKIFKEFSRDPFALSSLLEETLHLFPFHVFKKTCAITHRNLPSFSESKAISIIKEEAFIKKKGERRGKEEIEKRIKELTSELELIKKVEEKEELLSDSEKKLFRIKEQIEKRKELREKIELLEAQVKENAPLEELSQDVEGKLSNYKKLLKEREKIRAAFLHEIEPVKEEIERMKTGGIFQNPYVKIGAIVFGISILLLLIRTPLLSLIGAEELALTLRWFFLILVLGSIVAIFVGVFTETGKKARREELIKKLKEKETRLKKAENQIELELKKIEIIQKEMGLMSPDDLPEKVRAFNEAKRELEELKKELNSLITGASDEELEKEEKEISERIESLKKELQSLGTPSAGKHEIEEEIRKLKEEYETEESAGEELVTPVVENIRSQEVVNLINDLSQAMGMEKDEALSSLYNNLVPLLKDLSEEVYETITFDENTPGMRNGEGEFFPIESMSSSLIDLAFLSLVISFVEYQSELRSIPFLFDDIFITMDDIKREKFYKKLKEVAEKTGQGIVLSRTGDIAQYADNTIRI